MVWVPIPKPSSRLLALVKLHKKRMRFLVDENIDVSIIDFLRRKNWNAEHVCDVKLYRHPDESIYAYAFKHKRVLLTHDTDFLDHRRFPFNRNPGVIILPGGSGNSGALIESLVEMLDQFAPYYKLYRKDKIVFYKDGLIKIIFINHQGKILADQIKLTKQGPLILENV